MISSDSNTILLLPMCFFLFLILSRSNSAPISPIVNWLWLTVVNSIPAREEKLILFILFVLTVIVDMTADFQLIVLIMILLVIGLYLIMIFKEQII